MTLENIFLISLISLFTILAVYGFWVERYLWNNGISRRSGKPWKYIDRCFAGDRGYTDDCGNTVWISWPGIDGK